MGTATHVRLFSYASGAVPAASLAIPSRGPGNPGKESAPSRKQMTLAHIRNAIEMTTHPKLSQLLALLIEHGGLAVRAAAQLLDLPNFMVLRFAIRLVRLGYATRVEGTYFPTI